MTEHKRLTENGTLSAGIWFGGEYHRQFEIRLPVMRDTSAALVETEDEYGTIDGYEANTFYRLNVLARALIQLGTIPETEVTTALLLDELSEDDYDALQEAVARLKVKRSGEKPASQDSDLPLSPSDDAASQKNG